MLLTKCSPRQTALFILHDQPVRFFPAPATTCAMCLCLIHEPSTSPAEIREKNGLARAHTLERLCVNGFDKKPPRTIQTVKTRYIVFSDGAQLTFPTAEQFHSQGDVIKWNTLYYRVALKEAN